LDGVTNSFLQSPTHVNRVPLDHLQDKENQVWGAAGGGKVKIATSSRGKGKLKMLTKIKSSFDQFWHQKAASLHW